MRADFTALLVGLGCLAAAAIYYLACHRRGVDDERGLPKALRGAQVAFAEETFKSLRLGLVARLDRAYEIGQELVLVELKTRAKSTAYMKDIIELSVQRLALQDQTHRVVSMTAWVVVENPETRKRSAHQVTLLDEGQVKGLRDRYVAVAGGWTGQVKGAATPAQCRSCGHAQRCTARKR